ncbi:hypothetical protein [Streptomyces sp. S.PB5]|uniref:hypothetical protein n=1 Tax=Streptomyces sp. S.PB5 TaxID=3020844 RepID=UPI0025B0C8A0|nr:hypothetical protein [Streptomyces sp. S.PB5]MDN3025596.1 hypothetical protein [Streptomyces sp. S.PB5]
MGHRTGVTVSAALTGTAAALSAGIPAQAAPTAGAPGPETLGDPVLPSLGNDGYRVSSYDIAFEHVASTKLVNAVVTVNIAPTQEPSRLSLDARTARAGRSVP